MNITNLNSNDTSVQSGKAFNFEVKMTLTDKYTMTVNNKSDIRSIRFRIDDRIINETNVPVSMKIQLNSSFSSYIMTTSKNYKVKVIS